jgi:hypothetical protein
VNATSSATIKPIARSSNVVSRSLASSIFSDWYGFVKKKSYDIAATIAVSAPNRPSVTMALIFTLRLPRAA